MKKKTVRQAHHAPHFYILFAVVMLVIGAFSALVATKVIGQTTTKAIYACAQNKTGNLRMVTSGTSCHPDETAVSWNIQGPEGPAGASATSASSGLPFSCAGNCDLSPFAGKFAGQDFTGAQLYTCFFKGADLTGVIFKKGNLDQCNFTNANLTNADLSYLVNGYGNNGNGMNINVTGANLTGANLSNDYFQYSHFQNTNLQNTNFSNTTLKNVNFSGAQNMSTANITGVTWDGDTCPDGSYSNSDGNTCAGHF